jgi:DNA mismatch endonuclease (patch repair protein)
MQGNVGDSSTERALRSALHRQGRRFRKQYSPVPGVRCRADVVFPSARLLVFVDGCFWHRCPQHGTSPKTNSEWWRTKLDANVERDRRNDSDLRTAGWSVLRFWEHEPVDDMVSVIVAALDSETDMSPKRQRSRCGSMS